MTRCVSLCVVTGEIICLVGCVVSACPSIITDGLSCNKVSSLSIVVSFLAFAIKVVCSEINFLFFLFLVFLPSSLVPISVERESVMSSLPTSRPCVKLRLLTKLSLDIAF